MDAQLSSLLNAFRQDERGAPTDLASFLRGLPDAGALPSPWETWTLIGLVRHRARQLWVLDIINTRLRGDPSTLAAFGALGHPEGVRQQGSVPGMPEWEYYFHGRGCCLTHKVTGEDIDVDFWDDTAEYFDTFFYTKYLKSLREPESAEQRLLELHPSCRSVTIAITDLLTKGALIPLPERESHPYCVPEDVLAHSEEIAAFCSAWADPEKRLWSAALIGDWPAAHEAAKGQGLESITALRVTCCRDIRQERLLRETGFRAADALHGLADLGGTSLAPSLEEAFRGPPSGLISVALEIAGQQDDPRWCPHIHALFRRVDPAGQLPAPHIWMTSLKFLLRHGYRKDEILAAITRAGGTEIGEALLLALEHAPEQVLPLVRKGLLADVPMARGEVATILALIDRPWSKRELLGALEASDDQEKTADARAAILETGDDEAQKAVLAWEERNPHENEIGIYMEIGGRRLGPFYSLGEISLKDRATWIRYYMEKLHERVMGVRDVVPPEPPDPRPRWKFWGK